MANFRLRSFAKPALSVAGAGLGAALAGPLGGAIGGWLGDMLGASTSKLLKTSTDKFGEKIIEKIADLSTDFLADKLKATPIELEGLYRDALRRSLRGIQSEPELAPFSDWFINWERSLSGIEPLSLVSVSGEQLEPDKLSALFRDTMATLNAQGRALINPLPLQLSPRPMPERLDAALNTRLPAILRRNFRSLITTAEYEAAWKEATLLFRDVLQAELKRLGETTARIEITTRAIVEDTRAIRDRVEREPDAPLLVLQLAEPGLSWRIPPPPDRSADIQRALIAEARRLGAPDADWLAKGLAAKYERLREARKNIEEEIEPAERHVEFWLQLREACDPIDEMEEYMFQLEQWYRLAAYFLTHLHEVQTSAFRSVALVFRISNHGHVPAEKVTVELELPKDLSMNDRVAEPAPLGPPPEIPTALKNRIPETIDQGNPTPVNFYPGWSRSKPVWQNPLSRAEFFHQENHNADVQRFHCFIPSLEHGASKLTRPLLINFANQPARSLRITYTLHASNQVVNSRGEIEIEITETQTPPVAEHVRSRRTEA